MERKHGIRGASRDFATGFGDRQTPDRPPGHSSRLPLSGCRLKAVIHPGAAETQRQSSALKRDKESRPLPEGGYPRQCFSRRLELELPETVDRAILEDGDGLLAAQDEIRMGGIARVEALA